MKNGSAVPLSIWEEFCQFLKSLATLRCLNLHLDLVSLQLSRGSDMFHRSGKVGPQSEWG